MITPHPTEGAMSSPPHLLMMWDVSIYIEVPVVRDPVLSLLLDSDLKNSLNAVLTVSEKGTFLQLS